jgi:glutamine amidotransferase
MVAYLGGPEVTLSSVVLEPEHSLLVQSYAPKEMMSGVVNADGCGVGWYVPASGDEPAVYRSNAPMWSDRSFAGIAPKIRARTVFGAVRSATPGLPVEESGVPPSPPDHSCSPTTAPQRTSAARPCAACEIL